MWDQVLDNGRQFGFRNAQATVLAPTGTISFLMDCDTTGIEPDIALVKYKQLAGGGMLKIVNNTVPSALKTLGYDQPQIESILAYIEKEDTIEGAADLKPEHLSVFDCAFKPRGGVRSIAWHAHVTMMAAAQPFLSGAISKTVNMPRETTPDDIANAYTEGWRLGLKALAIYRDGSKESQPLSTSSEGDKAAAKVDRRAAPRTIARHAEVDHAQVQHRRARRLHYRRLVRRRPPRRTVHHHGQGRQHHRRFDGCLRHRGFDEPAIRRAAGSVVNKFSHTRFEPMGHTKNPDIRIAKSMVDYIFRWMGIEFLPGYREANKGLFAEEVSSPAESPVSEVGWVDRQGSGAIGRAPQHVNCDSRAAGEAKNSTLAKAAGSQVRNQRRTFGNERSRQESQASWKIMLRCCIVPAWRCTSTRTPASWLAKNSSPASNSTPPVATTAAPSRSATATAICATTAATAWDVRETE